MKTFIGKCVLHLKFRVVGLKSAEGPPSYLFADIFVPRGVWTRICNLADPVVVP